MRKRLTSKEEELWMKSNEENEASKEDQDSQRLLLDEVEHLRKLVASKKEEVQTFMRVFHEKMKQKRKLMNSFWCSFP